MKLTLLGTGDAVGTPKIGCYCPACEDAEEGEKANAFRFSILVESEIGRVLIDTSPDLRQQFLMQNLSSIDGVIWTHGHYDHYSGFGEFYRIQNKVDVYGIPETLDYINQYVSFLKPKYHYVNLCEPFELFGLQFTLIKVDHPPVEVPTGVIIREGVYKSSDYRRYKSRNTQRQPGVDERSGPSYCRCDSSTTYPYQKTHEFRRSYGTCREN